MSDFVFGGTGISGEANGTYVAIMAIIIVTVCILAVLLKRFTKKLSKTVPASIDGLESTYRKYFDQVLWIDLLSRVFSMMFAAVGFFVIIAGAWKATTPTSTPTILTSPAGLQVFSGCIISAISTLFFNQSKIAKNLMERFFETLRNDRRYYEGIKMIEKLETKSARDRLREQYIQHALEPSTSTKDQIDSTATPSEEQTESIEKNADAPPPSQDDPDKDE